MINKPVWSEGLLVSQHHFQQQDRYHEQLLGERLRGVVHYDWGVVELEIDSTTLVSEHFQLKRFRAIWPDGAVVACGEGYEVEAPAARSFEGAFPAGIDRLEIYLGVVHETNSTGFFARSGEPTSSRRFTREARQVTDANSGTSEQEVEWARPQVRIFLGDERRDGFSTIRVAELVRRSSGAAIVRDNYVPPVLRLGAAPFLRSGLSRVLSIASARRKNLASSGGANPNQAQVAAENFLLFHTLNGSLPGLSHLVETPDAHPEEAYIALCSLVGQLCSFSPGADPLEVPKFNYLDLGDTFERLFARVVALLSAKIQKAYTELKLLKRETDGLYYGPLSDQLAQKELFVAVQANLQDAVARELVPDLLKIAGFDGIKSIVRQASHGVRVTPEWNPSDALPAKPGACFFRLRREGSAWDEIRKTHQIALYLPAKDENWKGATLSVYAIDSKHLK